MGPGAGVGAGWTVVAGRVGEGVGAVVLMGGAVVLVGGVVAGGAVELTVGASV